MDESRHANAGSAALLSPALEYAVAAAGVGIWELDADTGEEVWSDLTLAMYGLPAGGHAPTRSEWRRRFLHPDDADRAAARAADFLSTGRPYELDYRIRRADGQVRWLHSRAAFAAGQKRRVVGVTLDITERRIADARASEALKLLDLTAQQVGFGFGYRDVGGDGGYWSPQLMLMFGLPAQASTPTREQFLAIVASADRARVAHDIHRLPVSGELRDFEYSVRRVSDGHERRVMTRGLVVDDAQGRPWRYFFVVIDLTEARAQDHRLAELLERLRLATEAGGIGTWEWDVASNCSHWDETMKALFDLPATAPTPGTEAFLDMLHPDDVEPARRGWHRLAEDDSAVDFELRVRLAGGRWRWLHSRGRSVRDAQGRLVRRLGICLDITERRTAEEARRGRELAERASAAKTEFLSRMSHELRTPLNAVLGFAQVMQGDVQDPLSATQRARLEHILAAGWHLLALINDVLDLTRIEARQLQVQMGAVPLDDVVAQSLAMNEVAARERAVTLHHGASASLTVWADATRLKQLLVNLISNAVKYNVHGGQVQVSSSALGDAELVIAVTDTGLGLDETQLAQLFQPFNRLGREHSGVEGTGIGLIVAKLLAEQMGGRLEVQSRCGLGSEFRVVLQRPQGQASPARPAQGFEATGEPGSP